MVLLWVVTGALFIISVNDLDPIHLSQHLKFLILWSRFTQSCFILAIWSIYICFKCRSYLYLSLGIWAVCDTSWQLGSTCYTAKSWAIFMASWARVASGEAKEWDEEIWSLACLWSLAGESSLLLYFMHFGGEI